MNFIDFCAGIGGFRLGMELAGHKCIGFCEKDLYAIKSYKAMFNTEGEWFADDITKLRSDEIPYVDCWTFGFPCQDISIAGKQRGIIGQRSNIYFKIIDLIKGKKEEDKPRILFIENVKNLLSINNGWDFFRVLFEMDEAGYDAEWQVLNSKNFGVPQNRERVFIIGHLRGRSERKILPITRENTTAIKQIIGGAQGERIYSTDGISSTLCGNSGGLGAKTGLYFIDYTFNDPRLTNECRCLKSRYHAGITNRCSDNSGVLDNNHRVRRLTPKECFRLQGFPDEYFERARKVNSDNQLYKQIGNAVTVNVAFEIAKKLKEGEIDGTS
jgi:DNA (cytosine-5)-methyltransferase 1